MITPTNSTEEQASAPRRRPEILAPAGTEEAFAAALASAADAVYLGLSEGFNARGRSTAFNLDALPGLVRRAHAANVKLYLTLNTLVFEDELARLERLLRGVVASGVDALIIQDPATAFIARALSPEIRLHASTQMTISSSEGAAFAATLGMQRVVLPRELSTREIARFTRESPMECEVFVHGALCMAWSGQCLTSEAFSERSANRGQCSQACRMPYEAIVDGHRRELGDKRYLLSPQDLAAHEALPELLEAGVHSLKIEGRYKGAAYVSTTVDSWRNWRDALLRGATNDDRERMQRDVERTQLTFSRGGSLGFLHGDNHQALVVAVTPKHRGLALGEIIDVHARSVRVALTGERSFRELLRPGMGVMFELVGRPEHDPENAPGGPLFGVRFLEDRSLELRFGQPGPDLSRVRAGDGVRLTGDPEIAREAQRRMGQPALGRIPVALRVRGRASERLSVEARACFGGRPLRAISETESALAPARSEDAATRRRPMDIGGVAPLGLEPSGGLDRTLLVEKLGAFGGTPFHLEELDLTELEPGLHAPVSELKRLRRELSAQLEAELLRNPYAEPSATVCVPELRRELSRANGDDVGPPELIPLCRTDEQLDAVIASGLGAGAEVELDWMEMVGLGRAVERARQAGLRVTLATVRVQKPGEETYDRRIANLKPDGVLVRHWGALMHFAKHRRDNAESPPSVHGDFSLNVTNSLTAHHLLGLGLATVTASHDLNQAQLLELLAHVPRGRVALTLHHHIPTFHNSHCVYAHLLSSGTDYRSCGRPCEEHRIALRDFAGHEHPVVVDVGCRNTVFNAFAQSAAPLVPKLLELGVRRFRVELVWERADEVTRTLAAYRRLLAGELSANEALHAAAVHERYGVTTPLRVHAR
jgi:putative protease